MLRTIAVSAAFFIACCAIMAFVGGVVGYTLSDGATPVARKAAAEARVEAWGPSYVGGIMGLAALLTVGGLVTRRLPGLPGKHPGNNNYS